MSIELSLEAFWGSSRKEARGKAAEYCKRFPRWKMYPATFAKSTVNGTIYVQMIWVMSEGK